MEKVKIPKFVAEEIEKRKGQYQTNLIISEELTNNNEVYGWAKEKGNFVKLAVAIEFGYEIETKPEEQLLEYYNRCVKYRDDRQFGKAAHQLNKGAVQAIGSVLDILGIDIEGIEKNKAWRLDHE